jgi:hypothetical protein
MKTKLMIMLLNLLATYAYGACCLGDGCPNVLGEYRDSAGNPTGKYALLDPSGNKIPLKGVGTTCACPNVDLTTWPPANCPQCSVVCPKCNHAIFQHSCDAKGNPGAGTKGLQ